MCQIAKVSFTRKVRRESDQPQGYGWRMLGSTRTKGASFLSAAPGRNAGELSLKSSELCRSTPESSAEKVEMAFSSSQRPTSQGSGTREDEGELPASNRSRCGAPLWGLATL